MLNDNDRQRIEQAAIVYTEGHGSTHKNWRGFIDGYKAATIYEREQQVKLQEFKTYVHKRLDDMGIPVDPDSPHKEHGCRIGGRLDALEAERSELVGALTSVLRLIDDGVLVRDISKDHESGWAIKQLPLIQTLGKAKSILDKLNSLKK